MIGFLPPIYRKILKREKIIRGLFSVFMFLVLAVVIGLVFLLPSYFSLIFSLDDVLRRTNTEEISLQRKDVLGVESRISYVNRLSNSYFENESKRKKFSEILLSITNSVSGGIKLTNIEFQKNSSGEFTFFARGEAQKRSDLILYSQKLRGFPQVKELRSPVSNLLQETNIKFLLEATIKPQYYE